MAKGQGYSRKLMAFMLAALLGGVALVACARTASSLDLTTVPACPVEDGPGTGGPVPCVWDAANRGNGQWGPYGTRWTLYAETCPTNTKQDYRLVTCIGRADWSGGVSE
jgi:hypothetical protein